MSRRVHVLWENSVLRRKLDELVSAAQFLKIKGLSKVTKEGLGINNHSK